MIKVIDQMQNVTISSKVEQSIVNYLFNNPHSDFIGRIYQSTPNFYDKIEPSDDYNNLFLDPGTLEADKACESINKLLTKAYLKIDSSKMPLQTVFVYRMKEEKVIRKIWTIFPNINFELNQIENISFSNTQLNKYLISKTKSNDSKEYKKGLLTLSKGNRLIALTDKHTHKNKVIIGLWLNFKEENAQNNQMDLNGLIVKYQSAIYQHCFEFVNKSSQIESVFSPNPSIFLLVLFYNGQQCQYEIRMNTLSFLNNKQDIQLGMNEENKWLIAKSKNTIDLQFECFSYCFDIKSALVSHDKIKVLHVTDFIEKKFKIDNQVSILTKTQAIKEDYNNNNSKLILPPKREKERDKTDEQLQELLCNTYLDIDSFDNLYDYPLIMPHQFRHNAQLNSNRSNHQVLSATKSNTQYQSNSKPNGEITNHQQTKKQNEELYHSQASTNIHSNLLLSLKHSNNTHTNNCNHNSINTLIQQMTQKVIKQSNTFEQLNNQITNIETKAHLLLNRILMSKKHTNDTKIQPTNTSIQVPHIRSINLTSFNEDD